MKPHAVPRTITLISLIALIAAPFAHTSFATNSNPTPPIAHRERLAPLGVHPIIAEFDGDRRLDQAELHLAAGHRCIRVRYGTSREDHLEFLGAVQAHGTLLARDINRDRKPDLIWISTSGSEAVAVWFGDGFGHFSKAADGRLDALRAGLFDRSDLAKADDSMEEQVCLTPDPISSEPAGSANLDSEIFASPGNAYCSQSCDPGPYLSYLRERGPPLAIPLNQLD